MVNAGPGLTAYAQLPELAGHVVRIQLEGVKPEHAERVRLLAGVDSLLDVCSYTDEGGERHSAGACLVSLAVLDGLKPGPDVVPVFHVPPHGPRSDALAPAAVPLQVLVELGEGAPWGASIRVIFTPAVKS
ncbi:hypothetical protein EYS42_08820 [Aquabacterium lacunae]|uniref:Uncharacterized protein n=1 Tax=Aquabacterium lacunae TaxID=2528630 RepID=A0A4Q9H2N9_9BURK|nr:hypothetical protein [Aquabacterium lacunae]TBO31337.1 hypothetical protein EYS42_08820 [Aquabacterium lacunae]